MDDGTVIEDVTLISPERPVPMQHAAVVIRDGRIAEIGSDLVAGPHAKRVDGRGRFLIPGLIDSHVHVNYTALLDSDARRAHPDLLQAYRTQLPRTYLAFGFTSLVDLDPKGQELSWFDSAPVHPHLYRSGPAVHIIGGYPSFVVPKDATEATAANILYEAAQAKSWPVRLDPRDYSPARAVDRVVDAGGICVKTFVEPGFGGAAQWPVPRPETLQSLSAEVRKRGLAFIIHANGVDSWRAAVDARANVIAHGLWHWPGDRLNVTPPREARDAIQAAARAGIGVQPTLQAVYGDQSIFDQSVLDDPRLPDALPRPVTAYLKGSEAQTSWRAIADEYRQGIAALLGSAAPDPATAMSIAPARATATLRMMVAEKTKLLFGSDTPSNSGIGNPPGLNGRLELSRWFEAGVPLPDILRAATLDNASAFGLSATLGTIQVGKRADLLLLTANPLETIAAYDRIETIFVNGEPMTRMSLLPPK